LNSYEEELIKTLLDKERLDKGFYDISEKHPDINEILRAKLIDWVLHCTKVCNMEEHNILFIVIDLIDNFYRNTTEHQQRSEFQLTAVSAILVASKLL
jgi:hypothetical protein